MRVTNWEKRHIDVVENSRSHQLAEICHQKSGFILLAGVIQLEIKRRGQGFATLLVGAQSPLKGLDRHICALFHVVVDQVHLRFQTMD